MSIASSATAVGSDGATRVRVTPNLFGIAFGLAGLTGAWQVAHRLDMVPAWPNAVLLVLTALVWVVLVVAWAVNVRRTGRTVGSELRDPVFAPFLGLVPTTAVLIGVGVFGLAPGLGRVLVIAAAAGVVVLGGWLTGSWIRSDLSLDDIHPGYYLPTVAGGLVCGYGLAEVGEPGWGTAAFGLGLVCWLLIGSIVLLRLLTRPLPPPRLVPTLAINLAPPVVAGNTHFALTGGRVDSVAAVLAGFVVLLVVAEVTMVGTYRRLAFSAGFWAFTFTYAAAATYGIRWAGHLGGPAARPLTWVLLGAVTLFIGAIAVRSVSALARGTFLLREPVPPAVRVEGRADR